MKTGDRVRVVIPISRLGNYTMGCAESLNGKTGIITKEFDKTAGLISDFDFTVEFDTPAKTWHSYSMPVTAFNFSKKDLQEIDKIVIDRIETGKEKMMEKCKINEMFLNANEPAYWRDHYCKNNCNKKIEIIGEMPKQIGMCRYGN